MKELEALLTSLNESLISNREVIRNYDSVKDNYIIVKSRANDLLTNNIIFDFDKYDSKYSDALASNDFEKANFILQEVSNSMDLVERASDEANRRLENFDSVYATLSQADIPRKEFLDQKKEINVSASKGNYDDVTRMCMAAISLMSQKVKNFSLAKEAILAAESAVNESKTTTVTGQKLLKQAESAFDSGDYLEAIDFARDSLSECLSSNEEYSEAMGLISNAEDKLAKYKSIIDLEKLELLYTEALESLNAGNFSVALAKVKEFDNVLEDYLDNSEPKIIVDLRAPKLVKDDLTKVTFEVENVGSASAENFGFEVIDGDKIVELGPIKQTIGRLEAGDKKSIILYLNFLVSGKAIPFNYELVYTNTVSNDEDSVSNNLELTVLSSNDQTGIEGTEFTPRSKAVFSPWEAERLAVVDGDSEIMFQYLDKHRESYLKYPQHESVVDYLNNNRSKFSDLHLYFDVPISPNDVLYSWGLPEKLKGNVILDTKRQAILDEILSSNSKENFVILGEPGIGKTSLLFELFDRFMERVPTGILSSGVTEIPEWNSELGMRLFYDDLPENDTLVNTLSNSSSKGIILSARRHDWDKLDINLRNKFTERSIEVFNEEMMYEVSKRMLNFSGIISSDDVIKKLIGFAEGSPIYVYSMIKELLNKNEYALHDDYVKVHARKGMHNYIAGLLQRLIMNRGESTYKEGGLHALACLYFLSRNINEKRCSMVFFRRFADNISEYTIDKLNSPKTRTFNDVLRYMSGSQSTVKFPHDTWADVVTNNTEQQSIFLQEIEDIRDRMVRTGIFEEVKVRSCKEAWERTKLDFEDDPNRYVETFFTMSETLIRNFPLDKLKSFEWFNVDYLLNKSSQYSNFPIAKQINNILESSQSQLTSIIIKDSVINRSSIGSGSINDGVINKE